MEYPTVSNLKPSDVAKYYLYRSTLDGELISPLKMQKLIYYAYAWNLVKNKKRIFDEQIEAWANGPVVPSLYHELKKYGSSPIDSTYIDVDSEAKLTERFPSEILDVLDKVYEEYMTRTAFELSVMTHNEDPWSITREGLSPTENSSKKISDDLIFKYYNAAQL